MEHNTRARAAQCGKVVLIHCAHMSSAAVNSLSCYSMQFEGLLNTGTKRGESSKSR